MTQENERWIFHNHPEGGAKTFDFTTVAHQLSDFTKRCHYLQTSPDSGFVQTTVCQGFTKEGLISLRGAVLKTINPAGIERRVIDSEKEYRTVLHEVFGLEIDTHELFTKVCQRHLDWLATNPSALD